MSDVLAGMTRSEAEALVVKAHGWTAAVGIENWSRLLALAALGARCVGAERGVVVGVENNFANAMGVPFAIVDVRLGSPTAIECNARVLVLEGE